VAAAAVGEEAGAGIDLCTAQPDGVAAGAGIDLSSAQASVGGAAVGEEAGAGIAPGVAGGDGDRQAFLTERRRNG
jgi:hypothetical protein